MGMLIYAQAISTGSTMFLLNSLNNKVANLRMADENMRAASLEFDAYEPTWTVEPYKHLVAMWDSPDGTRSESNSVFFGRVVQVDTAYGDGGAKVVHVVCESALGFLADSTIFAPDYNMQTEFDSKSGFVGACIARHNTGFGAYSAMSAEDRQWMNARTCGGATIPWERLDLTLVGNRQFGSYVNDGLDNTVDLLSRMQEVADKYGVIEHTKYSVSAGTLTAYCSTDVLVFGPTGYNDTSQGGLHQPDVVARHGVNINSITSSTDIDGVFTCVYAKNKAGNEAFKKNDALVAAYGYRQCYIETDDETQAEVEAAAAEYASTLSAITNVQCDIDYIDLSLIDGGYVRPQVGQLWDVHVASLGVHLRGWVKSCTWSADEPWSSSVVLHYCTEIEAEE